MTRIQTSAWLLATITKAGLLHAGHQDALGLTLDCLSEYAKVANDAYMKEFVRQGYEHFRNYGLARIGMFHQNQINQRFMVTAINLSDGGVGDYWEDVDKRNWRHSWDFMCAGSFMAADLSPAPKQQMRDWFMQNLARAGSEDRWVVAQDPREGNNGPHQMEHNGRGAYPAWPYHDGWTCPPAKIGKQTRDDHEHNSQARDIDMDGNRTHGRRCRVRRGAGGC